MLRTAHIEIDLIPIVRNGSIAKGTIIIRIHETQEIPGGSRITGHGISLALRVAHLHPIGDVGQRTLCIRSRLITFYMRKFQRQFSGIHRMGHAFFPKNRKRFTPITLATERRIADLVIDLSFSDTILLDPLYRRFDGIRHFHSIEEIGIFQRKTFIRIRFRSIVTNTQYVCDGEFKMVGELMIALVTARNTHDGTCSISGQHIFSHPDRN